MKHPKTKADIKKRQQNSRTKVVCYMRVATESQLEDQSKKQQIARFGLIHGTMKFIRSGK
jgi:hypothetical protein